jgi:hypothetical protein
MFIYITACFNMVLTKSKISILYDPYFSIFKYQAHIISQLTSDMERLQEEIQAQLVRPTLPFLVLKFGENVFSILELSNCIACYVNIDMDCLGKWG